MAVRRATFRLYPNSTQTKKLFEARRLHCYLYNACVAQRKTEYKHFHKSVKYFEQQNILPAFKEFWEDYQQLYSTTLQSTVKRVDIAFQRLFKGLSKRVKFQSIRDYSGWTYPSDAGWKTSTNGKHGTLSLNDLGVALRMRGETKRWGIPKTCTIVYRPSENAWYASISIEVAVVESITSVTSDLTFESAIAIDLGTATALTTYDGSEFREIENPRFIRKAEAAASKTSRKLKRKRAPNRKKKVLPSKRWKKARKQVSRLQRKVANSRKNWQHQITTEIARHNDIVVTEKLNTKGMTKKAQKRSQRKKQKAGLNKSILDVGFGTLNQMIQYKIEDKGGLVFELPTREVKPSQRCPNCGVVHKEWAELSQRHHHCLDCNFEVPRDRGSVLVMWGWLHNTLPGCGTRLDKRGCLSSTSEPKTRKSCGGQKQLGQLKRQKSQLIGNGVCKSPSSHQVG